MDGNGIHARCIFPPHAPDGSTPPDVLEKLAELAARCEVEFHFSYREKPPADVVAELEQHRIVYERKVELSDGTILLEGCRVEPH
jgi:hypothetical protein